jgi:hypothetical protein
MDTRKVARAVILVAIGVALSPFTSIPIGIAKINPVQHFVNVLGAVLLGPWWATGIALITGILRNALGTGTLLAFPSGMIGAFIEGFFYRYTRNIYLSALGAILVLRPSVLLLDEPFTHLDPKGAEQLRDTLRTIRSEGITMIIVEHRLHEIITDVDRRARYS